MAMEPKILSACACLSKHLGSRHVTNHSLGGLMAQCAFHSPELEVRGLEKSVATVCHDGPRMGPLGHI